MEAAAARVELADQVEQPRGGGIEMRDELRNLVAEPLQLSVMRVSRNDSRTIDVRRRVSLRRLYTPFFERP